MSKKCPYCSSYNTEAAVENWVGRGIVNIGRGGLALLGGVAMSVFHPGGGGHAAHTIWENTKPSESFKGYRCCSCGREFSA